MKTDPEGCLGKLVGNVMVRVLDPVIWVLWVPGEVDTLVNVMLEPVGNVIVMVSDRDTVSTRVNMNLRDTTLLTVIVVVDVIAKDVIVLATRPEMVEEH